MSNFFCLQREQLSRSSASKTVLADLLARDQLQKNHSFGVGTATANSAGATVWTSARQEKAWRLRHVEKKTAQQKSHDKSRTEPRPRHLHCTWHRQPKISLQQLHSETATRKRVSSRSNSKKTTKWEMSKSRSEGRLLSRLKNDRMLASSKANRDIAWYKFNHDQQKTVRVLRRVA